MQPFPQPDGSQNYKQIPRQACNVWHRKALPRFRYVWHRTSPLGFSGVAAGVQILKAPRKQIKGVVVNTSNSSSSVVEIRARPSQTQTGAQVLQALAEVCKSAAVAAYCGNLGQLCEATMIESLHNLGLADGGRSRHASPHISNVMFLNLVQQKLLFRPLFISQTPWPVDGLGSNMWHVDCELHEHETRL